MIDYTLMVVLCGASTLGVVSGALGAFALLRKQSLLGDAISHASLPGIALIFLITLSKHPLVLLCGALVAGWVGTLLVMVIVTKTKLKQDAALGIILSVFFGFGLVLLTIIQRLPSAKKAGLDSYLFGSAATLLVEDVKVMIVLGAITLFLVVLIWKEFKILSFDKEFAFSCGFPIKRLDILMTTLIVVAIVIGLQTVGVVLMSALIIAPAAAARQWTDRLSVMVILSAIFGGVSGGVGAYISSVGVRLPTGPIIVLVISTVVFMSLLFAPNRGILWGWLRQVYARATIREKAMLHNLLLFSESHTQPFYPHDIQALTAIGRGPARKALKALKEKGLAQNPEGDKWAITQAGLSVAKKHHEELTQ